MRPTDLLAEVLEAVTETEWVRGQLDTLEKQSQRGGEIRVYFRFIYFMLHLKANCFHSCHPCIFFEASYYWDFMNTTDLRTQVKIDHHS